MVHDFQTKSILDKWMESYSCQPWINQPPTKTVSLGGWEGTIEVSNNEC